MEERINLILKNLKGCWYDIVGSAESFMTEKDKYDYCKRIVEQNERQEKESLQNKN